jgi:hypothetical protein
MGASGPRLAGAQGRALGTWYVDAVRAAPDIEVERAFNHVRQSFHATIGAVNHDAR